MAQTDINPQILKQYLANLAYLRNSIIQDTNLTDEEKQTKLTLLNSENDEMLQTFDLYKVILELETSLTYDEIVAKINTLDEDINTIVSNYNNEFTMLSTTYQNQLDQKLQLFGQGFATFQTQKGQQFDLDKQTLFNNFQDQVNQEIQILETWKSNVDNYYSGKKSSDIFVGTEGLDLSKDSNGNYINQSDGARFEEEKDTFYPVVFRDVSWSQFKTILTIARASVHWDNNLHGNRNGSLFFECEYHISACGHGSDFYKFNYFRQSSAPSRGFIAKFEYHYTLGLVLWLRGQRHYRVSANGFAINPSIGLNGFVDDTSSCGTYNYQPIKLSDITDETQNIVVGG